MTEKQIGARFDPEPNRQYWFIRLLGRRTGPLWYDPESDMGSPKGEYVAGPKGLHPVAGSPAPAGQVEVIPFVRHGDDGAGLTFSNGIRMTFENRPGAYRRPLEALQFFGFVEMGKAKAAGLLPRDWDVGAEIRARHPWMDPEDRARRHDEIRAVNLAARKYARQGRAACPHCGNRDQTAIRFIDRLLAMDNNKRFGVLTLNSAEASYFICEQCARSFRLPTVQ